MISTVEKSEEGESNELKPLKDLIDFYANHCDTHSKPQAIIRGVGGITSVISSSTLIWMILKSSKGLSTVQHRLLLGLSISDILSSVGYSTFNMMAPADVSYFVWNAMGNQATCNVQGFLMFTGTYGGLFYNSTLNLYYLAVVRFEKNEEYIRTKIEPFLHGVPIVVTLIFSLTMLVKEHFNDDGFGNCIWPDFYAPHCENGYESEELRAAGFKIPCGRGLQGSHIAMLSGMVLMFIPIFIMITSLGLIYRSVRKTERKLEKYKFTLHQSQNNRSSVWSSIRLSMHSMTASMRWSKSPSTRSLANGHQENEPVVHVGNRSNNTRSQSRAVMRKALCYSFAWLASFGFFLIGMMIMLGGMRYPLGITYVTSLFGPLQGFFNFLIFMLPKVIAAKKPKRGGGRGEVSWCAAFTKAFWSRGGKGNNDRNNEKPSSQRSNLRNRRAKKTKNRTLPRCIKKKNQASSSQIGKTEISNTNNNRMTPRKVITLAEEEKCEIEATGDSSKMVLRANNTSSTYASNVLINAGTDY